MNPSHNRHTRAGSAWSRVALAALALAVAGGISAVWFAEKTVTTGIPTAVVRRGPLTISVTTTGTIQSRERVVVKSEVEGSNTILFLISEGTHVRAGDLLVELDSSRLVDQKNQQQIVVLNAEAGFIRARENLAVTKSQTESDIAKATLTEKFARLDLEKYVEGEYPRQLQKAESDITLSHEELRRAEEKLAWSEEHIKEGFVTQSELEVDGLAKKRAKITLDLAQSALRLLKRYSHRRTLEQLTSDVEQAAKALDRTRRKTAADIVQANAEFKAKESQFERQEAKLDKIGQQIVKCRIVAPIDGMVIHATTGQFRRRGSVEPLAEGQTVRERQHLIRLPTTSAMAADVKVHETSLRKIATGMPVRVTIDAMPGEVFWGRVARISLLPDAQSAWLNPDLKVYTTKIELETDTRALRPSMTCRAEIIVKRYEDALYVPVQAVARIGSRVAVYVQTPTAFVRRYVKVGLDNNRMIRIIDGVTEGEIVSLTPPLAASAVPVAEQTTLPARLQTALPARLQATSAPAASRPKTPTVDFKKLRSMSSKERLRFFENLTPEQRKELRKRMPRGRRPRGSRGGKGQEGRRNQ